jgi:hypothetical protein
MPTIRVSEENYGYILGVAARLQTEENKPKTPNDAINYLVEISKQTRETLGHKGALRVRELLESGKEKEA